MGRRQGRLQAAGCPRQAAAVRRAAQQPDLRVPARVRGPRSLELHRAGLPRAADHLRDPLGGVLQHLPRHLEHAAAERRRAAGVAGLPDELRAVRVSGVGPRAGASGAARVHVRAVSRGLEPSSVDRHMRNNRDCLARDGNVGGSFASCGAVSPRLCEFVGSGGVPPTSPSRETLLDNSGLVGPTT